MLHRIVSSVDVDREQEEILLKLLQITEISTQKFYQQITLTTRTYSQNVLTFLLEVNMFFVVAQATFNVFVSMTHCSLLLSFFIVLFINNKNVLFIYRNAA